MPEIELRCGISEVKFNWLPLGITKIILVNVRVLVVLGEYNYVQ